MELNNCNRTTAAMININDDGENIKAGAGSGQQSSLSSGRRERRSHESHCKSSTSSTSSHVRSRGKSQPKRSQSSSALVDEDGVVCPITPSTTPKFHRRNSLPTLSTRESSSAPSTSSPDLVVNKEQKYKVPKI